MDGCVSGLVYVKSSKNRVNHNLIEIIEFCLKIYDLWTHSHLWIGVWVGGWVDGWLSGLAHVKLLKIK